MSTVAVSKFVVSPAVQADILDGLVPDIEIHLYFGGVQRTRWSVDGPTVAREIVTNPRWLHRFAAVTFTHVMDEWLMSLLRFPRPFPEGAGLEIQIVNSAGVELCSVGPGKAGEFHFRPSQEKLFEISSAAVHRAIQSRVVRVNLSLTTRDDDTFGADLRRAIEGNVLWSEARFSRASSIVSSLALDAWTADKRATEDLDAYAMALALLQNVHDMLFAWPRPFTKAEMMVWRNFVVEVAGSNVDPEILILFCSLPLSVHGARIATADLDALGPRPEKHVEVMLRAVANAQTKLRKPRFSAGALFRLLPRRFSDDGEEIRGVACAPESVIDVLSGRKKNATQFYLDGRDRDAVAAHLEKHGFEAKKLPARHFGVMGVVSRVELWIVERNHRLSFVDEVVMRRFDDTITVNGHTFACQKRGTVAIYGIGKLMWLEQKNKTEEASRLRESLGLFHKCSLNGSPLGFPRVNGVKRNKRKIFFSDWDKTLTYNADKSVGIPCVLHAMDYTKHMENGESLDISWN